MPEYLYQIKGKAKEGGWQWPPLYVDKIEAASSKAARVLLEDMYGTKLPGGSLKKGAEQQHLMCVIKELTEDNRYLQQWFDKRNCEGCGKEYRIIEKYQFGHSGSQSYCTYDCQRAHKMVDISGSAGDVNMNGVHHPVIYRITNKTTGKCYIGKTTQAFTLRWYQHIFQSKAGSKFYDAVKNTSVVDWLFEVIEVIQYPEEVRLTLEKRDYVFSREMYWIREYNSIADGYNSVSSKNEEPEDNKLQIAIEFHEIPIQTIEDKTS